MNDAGCAGGQRPSACFHFTAKRAEALRRKGCGRLQIGDNRQSMCATILITKSITGGGRRQRCRRKNISRRSRSALCGSG
nr:MAG TPA: hypothetical protein [Caudoviricetes sp.]